MHFPVSVTELSVDLYWETTRAEKHLNAAFTPKAAGRRASM